MRLGDVAGLRQHQRDGVLGRGQDVRLRGVDDHHAPPGGRLDVHVVEPDAGPSDRDEVTAGLEHLGRHTGGRADDEGGRAGDGLDELVGRERQLARRARDQPSPSARGRDGESCLGDEDPRHDQSLTSEKSSPSRSIPRTRSSSDKA